MLVGKKVSMVSLPPPPPSLLPPSSPPPSSPLPPISPFFSGGDTERRGGINTAVATDVNAIFKGKTVSATFSTCTVLSFKDWTYILYVHTCMHSSPTYTTHTHTHSMVNYLPWRQRSTRRSTGETQEQMWGSMSPCSSS